ADLLDLDSKSADEGGLSLDMICHALQSHCPHNGVFAVSCLTPIPDAGEGQPRIRLEPQHLEEPLHWLATTMQAQDEARIEKLWGMTTDLTLLQRCVTCFARRYPDAPKAAEYQARLRTMQRSRRRNRLLVTGAAVVALTAIVWGYDALGYHLAGSFAAE